MELLTSVGATLIAGIIAFAIWAVFRRPVEVSDRALSRLQKRDDELEAQLTTLRDQRVNTLEENQKAQALAAKEGFSNAAKSRRGIHQEITAVKTHHVHKNECESNHARIDTQMTKLESVAVDLARVETNLQQSMSQADRITERQTALGLDLARLEERLNTK